MIWWYLTWKFSQGSTFQTIDSFTFLWKFKNNWCRKLSFHIHLILNWIIAQMTNNDLRGTDKVKNERKNIFIFYMDFTTPQYRTHFNINIQHQSPIILILIILIKTFKFQVRCPVAVSLFKFTTASGMLKTWLTVADQTVDQTGAVVLCSTHTYWHTNHNVISKNTPNTHTNTHTMTASRLWNE